MSRVYSALTGATRPAGPAVLDAPDDGVWENTEEPATPAPADDAPYVEIGGPGGPVFSASLGIGPIPRPLASPFPELKVEAKIEPARAFPRLAPATSPAYLSVRFHDVLPRGTLRIGDGPDASLVAFHLPEHPVTGEYRTLRDEIRKQLPDATARVLLFTAAAAEAGTSTVLLNLGVVLAAEGKTRVMVVDGNLSRPALGKKLGLKPGPGVCEVLANRIPLTIAVQPSAVVRLDALVAGDALTGTPIAVAHDFPRTLAQLRQWYDWVLVDAGVWGGMPERDAACPSADAVYLVTRETDAERPEFLAVRGWVKELGGHLRGYVATRV
jgi:hypothetical protein